ncbi:hypothetical protein [Demequina maris]|uniref:hypothetical protein n=1 Tax=Demequina maris TaxID=1638982 RepID=UPI00078545FA|nr:hypothetical protein [Demequina maris]
MTADASLLAEARAALESTTLPERYWAIGELKDDRLCLLRDGGRWVAGYFERGNFDPEFTEDDTGSAITRFIGLVQGVVGSTERSAAATEEWLRAHGQERP